MQVPDNYPIDDWNQGQIRPLTAYESTNGTELSDQQVVCCSLSAPEAVCQEYKSIYASWLEASIPQSAAFETQSCYYSR